MSNAITTKGETMSILNAINSISELSARIEKELLRDYNPKAWVAKYGKGPTPKDVATMLARKALS